VTGAPPILDRIEAIAPNWLDQVFVHAGLRAAPVASVRCEPVGNGNTSAVQRLTLAFKGDPGEAPPTLIAKFPKVAGDGKTIDPEIFGYEREVAAYRYFAGAPFRLPKCYLAQSRPGGAFNLILEELGAGCRPGDQIAGCSIADAEAVVRELTALHAFSWKRPVLAESWPRRRAPNAAQSTGLYDQGVLVMRERHAERLGPAAMRALEATAPLVEAWSAWPLELSLIHTDPRVDNIIFEETPAGLRACLIDLQSIAVGEPACDLAYFLTGSLSPRDRAACERRLVAGHAAAMAVAGADFDPEQAWESYCANAISGLVATVSAAGMLAGEPRADPLIFALAERNCAAVLELDGIAAVERRIGAETR
jgi:hypothetical protein